MFNSPELITRLICTLAAVVLLAPVALSTLYQASLIVA
jgi:hypothetical protein